MVSIVIPSRNEKFLQRTIQDILEKALGEIEVIAVVDGYWPDPPLVNDPRLHVIHRGSPLGMRPGINAGAAIAKGEFLMKTDGHCMFDEGFDVKLAADCEEDWVVTPRRKRLDADNWCITESHKPDIDYMYLSFPDNPADWGGKGLNGKVWEEKNRDLALKEVLIDDLMSAQGSSWFMHRDYFHKLELMDTASYGSFANEAQEIMLKCWLSGGRCIVNKKTWYAHLHKGKSHGRGYFMDERLLTRGATQTNKWWKNEAWDKQTIPFEWLVEKFWPVPGWPEDWRERLISIKEGE